MEALLSIAPTELKRQTSLLFHIGRHSAHSPPDDTILDIAQYLLDLKPSEQDKRTAWLTIERTMMYGPESSQMRLSALKHLLSCGYPKKGPRREHTLLHLAAKLGDVVLLDFVLSLYSPADGTQEELSPRELSMVLQYAAKHKQLSSARTLLRAGADWISQDYTNGLSAFYIAVDQGDHDMVRLLLEEGRGREMKVSEDSPLLPLHVAVTRDDIQMISLLMEANRFPINAQDHDGSTALFVAAHCGNVLSCESLLNHPDIDVRLPRYDGASPLWIACQGGHCKVAVMLLDRGARVNAPDCRGTRPLHCAIERNNVELVRLLLSYGALASETDDDERSRFVLNKASMEVKNMLNLTKPYQTLPEDKMVIEFWGIFIAWLVLLFGLYVVLWW